MSLGKLVSSTSRLQIGCSITKLSIAIGNVTQSESLFSYKNAVFSSFQHPDHTPVFTNQLDPTADQLAVCGEDKQCLYDYSVTGSVEIATATMKIAENNTMDSTILGEIQQTNVKINNKLLSSFFADNFPPNITGQSTFIVRIGQMNTYSFTVQDAGDNITVRVIGELPSSAYLEDSGEGRYSLHWIPPEAPNTTLTLLAVDSLGASSTLTPSVHVCACMNEGNCTLEGLPSSDASTVIMNCDCTKGNATNNFKESFQL